MSEKQETEFDILARVIAKIKPNQRGRVLLSLCRTDRDLIVDALHIAVAFRKANSV